MCAWRGFLLPEPPRTPSVAAGLDLPRSRTFDEIALGDCAGIERTLTAQDLQLSGVLSGEAM